MKQEINFLGNSFSLSFPYELSFKQKLSLRYLNIRTSSLSLIPFLSIEKKKSLVDGEISLSPLCV